MPKHMFRHIAGLAGVQRWENDYADFCPQWRKGSYGLGVGVLRNLRARISLKVTAQFIPELRLHNKKGPNEWQLVETLGP